MSDSNMPLLLDKGLDLVTPPLLAEPGAIIDCLNYEMASDVGYRRLDGYERYDGYPDGGVANYLTVSLDADVGADQPQLVAGSILQYLVSGSAPITIGVVVEVTGGNVANYVNFRRTVTIQDTDHIYLTTPSGNSYFFTATSGSVSGKSTFSDAGLYVQQLRDYSAQLRALVVEAPAEVAGLNYSRDRLYEAVNIPSVRFTILSGSLPAPPVGATIRWKGYLYTLLGYDDVQVAGGDQTATVYLLPIAASTPVNDSFIQVDSAGTTISTFASVATAPTTANSKYAALGYANNPQVSVARGFTYLTPAAYFNYDNGNLAGGLLPLPGTYYAVGGDGAVLEVQVKGLVTQTGTFAGGDSTGRLQASIVSQVAGTRNYLKNNDVIHSEYPTTGTSNVFVINGDPALPLLAGTGSLRDKATRYQWGTYNFFADSSRYELYGTNGVFRAFWASSGSYGNIITIDDSELDNPKYLSFHAGNNLALGFAEGSVQLSVGGDPTNFSGAQGALEFGTGDNVTGLLEASGDTTIVFGKRSIRRIQGTSDADASLKTVVPNAGSYDYTAVNVAGQPVFCDPNGVSTLQQSSAYGDFVGERATYKISTWLYPKLVPAPDSIEIGGVACAMPVREKNQYRLFLNSGEVVSLFFGTQGPRPMTSDYAVQVSGSPTRDVRVPLAWSSEVDDTGKEQLHIVWDKAVSSQGQDGLIGTIPNPKQPYKLDYGWGFDGKTFAAHFDTAHVFMDNGTHTGQIVRTRVYGLGYGLASMSVTSSSIETNFDQTFQTNVQNISMPLKQEFFYDRMQPVTNIADIANWGLGIKLRISCSPEENTDLTEPSHVCQVLLDYIDPAGAQDY